MYALNTSGLPSGPETPCSSRGAEMTSFCWGFITSNKTISPLTVLLQGAFVKQLGDGAGNVSYDTYTTIGGIFTKAQGVTSNPEGNNEQNTTVYEIMFSNTARALG